MVGVCNSTLTTDLHGDNTNSIRMPHKAPRLLMRVILTLRACLNLRVYMFCRDFLMSFFCVQRLEMS